MNPAKKEPAQIISEIEGLQKDLTVKLGMIQNLAESLYRQVRKATADDNTPVYIAYANAWIRFSKMVNQGSNRTVRASRVLKLIKSEQENQQQPKIIDKKPIRAAEEANPVDSLLSMYAEDADLPPVSNENEVD